MGKNVQIPDLDGRKIVSGIITAAAVLGAFTAVDLFLVPNAQLLPDFIQPLANWAMAFGFAAFVYRQIKE